MFDEDPKDSSTRILCYHPESDCLFVVKSRAEFMSYCQHDQIDDVTGIKWAEDRFSAEGQ